MLDRAAERFGQVGTIAEPHHEIRPPAADAQIGSKLPAHGENLDRLVDEGVLEVERRRLKGEPLAATTGFGPIGRFILVGDEHGDTGRTPELALILPVFVVLREHLAEDQAADPTR